MSDNETYLLIKYIKSVLWRVAKRLSYIQDARCLKVKQEVNFSFLNDMAIVMVLLNFIGFKSEIKSDTEIMEMGLEW